MSKKGTHQKWLAQPQAQRPKVNNKEEILGITKEEISHLPKMLQKVSRVEMRANRIYLYELIEQFKPEGAVFMKPLIDDKYLEFPYARITMLDSKGDVCTADWQRHNNQWISLFEGTLKECLESIENDNNWF